MTSAAATRAATTRAAQSAGLLAGRRAHTIAGSPVGPLTLVAVDGVLAGLYLSGQRDAPAPSLLGERDAAPFAEAACQLEEYFAGSRTGFSLELALAGTPFQRSVWQQLRSVPYGHTITYAGLAVLIGRPGACRAVGLANGRNPVSIIIPCHRVIGSDGSLTGYGGGLDRKRQLLELERQGTRPGCASSSTQPWSSEPAAWAPGSRGAVRTG